ncbi:MAG: chitobiase/beta-hexosaminidase C-terminal domain-containing protein [Phycisphaerales bacterium]|nr:chitobiase/beta-hexosaminidase C-terminal domain-containing protein [Phycisphaerales bacterium]
MANVRRVVFVVGLAMSAFVALVGAGEVSADSPRASTAPNPPEVQLKTKPTLYVVGYAHLDTEWRWAYPQTIREFIADTLHKNFELFEKYPDYVFNFSGSRRYQMMREYYPAEYEKLKGYISAGKWFPCGSSVDENDANVPSTESCVRQVMYGNKFFRREFGIASEEFMLPDCFGFPAALPTLLNHCGIQGFSTQKLTWGSPVGIPFKVGRWIGPDDSEVLAALDPGAYVGQVKENLANSESWKTRIDNNGKKSGVFVDYHYYGTGDMGGAPTPESVAKVQESVNTDGAIKVITGPADWMFKAIKPEMRSGLPTYKGELLLTEHSAGSITSQAYMKRWNRKNELLADAAERAAVGAWWLTGEDYPAQRLEDAWSLVLGSQMHDILPGTSLPKAYEYAWNDEVIAGNIFSQVLTHAVDTISSQMDTHTQGTSVVVYNPLAIARTDAVDAEIPWKSEWRAVRVLGPDGKDVAAQVVSVENGNAHIVFAPTVLPMSLSTFDVRPIAAEPGGPRELKVADRTLESEFLKVTIADNGDVASVFDKMGNREVLAEPARLALLYEKPRDWPAWNMDWADRQLPPRSFVGQAGDGPAEIAISENGRARVAIRVKREHNGSVFTQEIRLAGAGERVEFQTHIDWNTQERSLKQAFVLNAANPNSTYDIQAGAITRGNNNEKRYENPSHQWFDLTDPSGSYGVSVLNDSKYGSDKPDDKTLRLTLLYTPGVRGGYQDQGTQDIGRHEMLYALYPHAGDWSSAKTPEQAARLNSPLRAFVVPRHAGPLGKQISLGSVAGDGVQVVAIKKAEASDAVIVRLRETAGKQSSANVRIGNGIASAMRVDGQERETAPATIEDGAVKAVLTPFSLKAFALKLTPPAAGQLARPTAKPIALTFDSQVATTNGDRGAAAIDGEKRSMAKEQMPRAININGTSVKMGGDGGEAIACKGQVIELPSDSGGTVYVLAAARNGDRGAEFAVGDRKQTQKVQSWRGYVGQWDNRLWKGEVPEMAFQWKNEWAGLVPGYVKPAPIAWFNSHYHTPAGDAHYQYSYVFLHTLEAPAGAKTMTLPDDADVLVFGATMVEGKSGGAVAAWPLFDTLKDHVEGGVRVVTSGDPNDAVTVSIRPELYWRDGAIRYTTDGSEPTAASPVYASALTLSTPTVVKAAMVDSAGKIGKVNSLDVKVNDTTGPKLIRTDACVGSRRVVLTFSEPLDSNVLNIENWYCIHPRFDVNDSRINAIRSVSLTPDSRSIVVELEAPLKEGVSCQIMSKWIGDRAPNANHVELDKLLNLRGPVYTLESFAPGSPTLEVKDVAGLPMKGSQPWTINCFVKMDKQPDNRTLIAGFGRTAKTTGGDGRYLAKFSGGAHFWSHHGDLSSTSAFELGRWQMLTATFDGKTVRLYKDGTLIGENEGELADDENVVRIAPIDPWEKERRFGGEIRSFTIWDQALSADALQSVRDEAKVP